MASIVLERPRSDEYGRFFERYVARVPGDDALSFLAAQRRSLSEELMRIPESRAGERYAEGKWSIREVVGHMTDTERIMAYRALCIARGEANSLPGFDENAYMTGMPFEAYSLGDLVTELDQVRGANLSLLSHLDDAAWRRVGTANNHKVSVRALAFVMAGHVEHHRAVLRERYKIA